MTISNKWLAAGGALLALTACNQAPIGANGMAPDNSSNTTASNDPVASAESAAPAAIAHDASVVTMDDKGAMTTVRQGKNGWVCIPDSPTTPGPDPMCADSNAAGWLDAYVHHKPPPADKVGLIYMLEGGTDASNTDPYAAKPAADNDWVKTGPHVMVVGSKDLLSAHPSGAKPDTAAPYVMWAGTPYAHLMVPSGK
jgi:hypothetical protein